MPKIYMEQDNLGLKMITQNYTFHMWMGCLKIWHDCSTKNIILLHLEWDNFAAPLPCQKRL